MDPERIQQLNENFSQDELQRAVLDFLQGKHGSISWGEQLEPGVWAAGVYNVPMVDKNQENFWAHIDFKVAGEGEGKKYYEFEITGATES